MSGPRLTLTLSGGITGTSDVQEADLIGDLFSPVSLTLGG